MNIQEQVESIIKEAEEKITKITGCNCKLTENLNREISIEEFKKMIEREFDVKFTSIEGRSRINKIVVARHTYIWFSRKHFRKTFPSIAAELNRDHSSIMQAVKAVDNMIETKDPLYYSHINFLKQKLHYNETETN